MHKYNLILLIILLFILILAIGINSVLKRIKFRERINFYIIKTRGLYKNTCNFEGTIFNKGCFPIYIDTILIIDKKTKEIKEEIPCYSYCILPEQKLSFNLNRYSTRSHVIEVLTELGNSKKATLNV